MKAHDLNHSIEFHLRDRSLSAREIAKCLGVPIVQVNRTLYKGAGLLFHKIPTETGPPLWNLLAYAEIPLDANIHPNSVPSQPTQSLLQEEMTSKLLDYHERALKQRAISPEMQVPPLIVELGLSTRSRNALWHHQLRTTRVLLATTPEYLLQIPNFGIISLLDVAQCFAEWGIWFGDHVRNIPEAIEGFQDLEDASAQLLSMALDSDLTEKLEGARAQALHLRQGASTAAVPLLVENLGFNVRATNCLRQASIVTTEELLRSHPSELLLIKNFGKNTLIEVVQRLSDWGICFGSLPEGVQWSEGEDIKDPRLRALPGADRLEEIIDHIRTNVGATCNSISDQFQIPVHTIEQLLGTHFRVDFGRIDSNIRQEFRRSSKYRKELELGDRVSRMIEMRSKGYTLQEIGDAFSLTRERVRQLITKAVGGAEAGDLYRIAREKVRGENFRNMESLLADWDGTFPVSGHISQALEALPNHTTKTAASVLERWYLAIEDWLYLNPGCTPEEFEAATGVRAKTAARLCGDLFLRFVIRKKDRSKGHSDSELLAALRQAATYEYPLSAKRFTELVNIGEIAAPTAHTITIRFGSWNVACKLAGIEGHDPISEHYDRRWSERDLWVIAEGFLLLDGHRAGFREFEIWLASRDDLPSGSRLRQVLGHWADIKRAIYLSSSFREKLAKHVPTRSDSP